MNKINAPNASFALFNLGFRPFFLGAALYSIVVMLLWLLIIGFNFTLPMTGFTRYQWHAHEMVYGYAMAVIAGFLLTAVKNWTGIQTLNGLALAILFSFWLISRVLFLFGSTFIFLAGIFDLLFITCLSIAVARPIIKAKNWKQLGILSKLILLAVGNTCFYLGTLGMLEQGIVWGIYGGFYLVIGLIMTIGSRVIPFFIERGVAYDVKLTNPKWLTILGLLIFLVFFISELFLHNENITGVAATGLFIVYSIRLKAWYTSGIWKKPLLWSLFLAMTFINIGFLLFALSSFFEISKFLAIHAFAYGGIGLLTVAMMARVALGHTGRNINEPPKPVRFILIILLAGAVIRVLMPFVLPDYYLTWMIASQLFWIAAFSMFVLSYAPILLKPRIDGKFG